MADSKAEYSSIQPSERINLVKMGLIALGSGVLSACRLPLGKEEDEVRGVLQAGDVIELSLGEARKPYSVRYNNMEPLYVKPEMTRKIMVEGREVAIYTPEPFVPGQEIARWPGELLTTEIKSFRVNPAAYETGVGIWQTPWTVENRYEQKDERLWEGDVVRALRVSTVLKRDYFQDGTQGDFETNKLQLGGESREMTNGFALVKEIMGEYGGLDAVVFDGYVLHGKALIPA